MILKFLKQLVCFHKYESEYDNTPSVFDDEWYEQCRYCGKERKVKKVII